MCEQRITESLAELFWELYSVIAVEDPVLPFLVISLENGKENHQKKQGFFLPSEPLKSLEKKGKTFKKTRKSSQERKKNKEFQTKTRKGRTGELPNRNCRDLFVCALSFLSLFSGERQGKPTKKNKDFLVPAEAPKSLSVDQITHLTCARLKHDLYDFWGGVLGPFPVVLYI